MRYLILFLIAFMTISCEETDLKKVEYHTTTMMGRTVTTVTPDSVVVTFSGRGEPTHYSRKTKSGEWASIVESVKDIKFDEIAELEAPSNKRATDAAPFAKFVFETKKGTFESNGFDGGNPHEMLMPVMKAIEEVKKGNEK
ncbi:MAG: hypothetical protein WDZ35_16435 [Crocinitomicaceae bacterium]